MTVQVGTYSNFVGAHFWNLQDEYLATPVEERELSPSVLFREVSRRSESGLTYAPRLQVVDLDGAFGSISVQAGSVLTQLPTSDAIAAHSWSGRGQCYTRPPVAVSPYVRQLQREDEGQREQGVSDDVGEDAEEDKDHYGLDTGVSFWSDYLKTRFHPRSCFPLPGVHAGVADFALFDEGSAMATNALLEDMYDELRFFVEECDSLGGLQFKTNADDAFAGLTASYLSHIREELGSNVPIFVSGVHHPSRQYTAKPRLRGGSSSVTQDALRVAERNANEARLVASCADFAAQYVPCAASRSQQFTLIHVEPGNNFQSSAVVALAMDVALTPVRHNISLAGLCNMLRPAPFAVLSSIACRFPVVSELVPARSPFRMEGMIDLSNAWVGPRNAAQNVASANQVLGGQIPSAEVVTVRGLECKALSVHTKVHSRIAIPVPFPRFFDASIDMHGRKVTDPSSVHGTEPVEVGDLGAVAGFATDSFTGYCTLAALGSALSSKRIQTASKQRMSEPGLLLEPAEVLKGLAGDYKTL